MPRGQNGGSNRLFRRVGKQHVAEQELVPIPDRLQDARRERVRPAWPRDLDILTGLLAFLLLQRGTYVARKDQQAELSLPQRVPQGRLVPPPLRGQGRHGKGVVVRS